MAERRQHNYDVDSCKAWWEGHVCFCELQDYYYNVEEAIYCAWAKGQWKQTHCAIIIFIYYARKLDQAMSSFILEIETTVAWLNDMGKVTFGNGIITNIHCSLLVTYMTTVLTWDCILILVPILKNLTMWLLKEESFNNQHGS